MSIWGSETFKTFNPSQGAVPSSTLSNDLLIAKANPAVILAGSESNAQQTEWREVAGAAYEVVNATFNGTNWVCRNTASPAYGKRWNSNGSMDWIYTAATAGSITWIVAAHLDNSLGNLTIGPGNLATGATAGFPYAPTMAGKPTGTPSALAGFAPFVWDDTNKQFNVYSPGTAAWGRISVRSVAARSHATALQTISNNTITALQFPTNDYNNSAVWSSGANTKFTAPVAGIYAAAGGVCWASAPPNFLTFGIRKNGSGTGNPTAATTQIGVASTTNQVQNVHDLIVLAANDYIEFTVSQNSGGNFNTAPGGTSAGDTFGSLVLLQAT